MHTIYIDFKDRKGPTIIDSFTLSPAHAVGPEVKMKAQNTDFTFDRRKDDYSQDLNRYYVDGTRFTSVVVEFGENGTTDPPKPGQPWQGYICKNAVIMSWSSNGQSDTVGVVCERIERVDPRSPGTMNNGGWSNHVPSLAI